MGKNSELLVWGWGPSPRTRQPRKPPQKPLLKVKGDFEFLLQNEEFQREDKEESKKSLP
jgi:hypothetical protein